MASNSTKSFLADAGYGEQELDANSALMELDKGIGKSGLSDCRGKWRHQAEVASGRRGRRMRTASPAGACAFGESGKLPRCWIGLGLVEQVQRCSDGPALTTWEHSTPDNPSSF